MRQPSDVSRSTTNAWRELLLLAISLLLASGMWLYSQWVMVPAERAHYAAMGQSTDVGDLYPRWYGTRELLLHHRDPYSSEVSREIQVAYYGHPLDIAGADRGRDEQRFAYPVYVVFFLAPTVELTFAEAQVVVRWTLAFLVAASVLLWMQALLWQPSFLVKLALIVLTVSSPPAVQALRLQQLAVLSVFFLAGSMAFVSRGKLLWAGCLLACATIKPQLALLPVLLFLIWVTGNWKRRQRLLWGFGGTLAMLALAGQALLPGWFGKFILGLLAYRNYVVMRSWLDPWLTPVLARPITGVLLVVLLGFCVLWRKGEADTPVFFGRLSLVLAAAVIALPLLPPFNQLLLLPGVLLICRYWNVLWNRGPVVRLVSCLGATVASGCWFMACVLAGVHALAPPAPLSRVWELPFLLSLALPPIVGGLLAELLQVFSVQTEIPRSALFDTE